MIASQYQVKMETIKKKMSSLEQDSSFQLNNHAQHRRRSSHEIGASSLSSVREAETKPTEAETSEINLQRSRLSVELMDEIELKSDNSADEIGDGSKQADCNI